MREAVIDRLHAEFGEPTAESPTACSWHLTPGFDLIVEKDSVPHQGVVWMPCDDWASGPKFSEFYDGASDRHEGTYQPSCPSLAKGRSALRLSIQRQHELDWVIERIRAMTKPGISPG